MAGPALLDLEAHIGVHAVDDASSDDAVDNGAREEVGRGRARQSYVLITALRCRRVGLVPCFTE